MRLAGVYPPALRFRAAKLLNARVVWAVALGIVLIQVGVTGFGGVDRFASIYGEFGLTQTGILSGKVWQLLTYGLLHGGVVHVVTNALFVLLLGSTIEHVVGGARVMKIMLAGILGGGIFQLFMAPHGPDAPILVGWSGGCAALLLFLTTVSPQSRMWPLPVSGKSLGVGVLIAELLLALIDPKLGIPGFSEIGETLTDHGMGAWFSIAHACHFGGGLAGFLCGKWMLRPRITLDRLRRERARREAMGAED